MKRKILSILLLSTLVLSGCGFTESGQLMSDARKYIEDGEYNKAMSNLSKVLDEDEANTEARGMYYQALKLQKATKSEKRKDYEQAIIELQDLVNDNSGSAKIRSQAQEMLDRVKDEYDKQKKAVIVRKENAKKSAEENKNKYVNGSTYGNNYNKYKNQTGDESVNEPSQGKYNPNTRANTNQGGTINNGANSINRSGTVNNGTNNINRGGTGGTGQVTQGNTGSTGTSGGQKGN